jgi:hypothetical protein
VASSIAPRPRLGKSAFANGEGFSFAKGLASKSKLC